MNREKMKIELDEKEFNLINELNQIQDKISDLDTKNLSNDLMESIKIKSIETITTALGLSDILENTIHNTKATAFENEMKNYQKWENMPKSERPVNYINKYTTGNEFKQLLNKTKKLSYKSKEHRKLLAGREFDLKKKEVYKNNPTGEFTCGYTGDKIYQNSNIDNKKVSFEHKISVKEIYNDKVMNYTSTLEERREFTNSDKNIETVRLDVNKSLNDTSVNDLKNWKEKQNKKDPNKNNAEYYEIDDKLMDDTINEAKDARKKFLDDKKKIRTAKEKIKVAGANALKSGAKAAVGQLLTITITETINEFKKENSEDGIKIKITNISKKIKEKAKEIINTFKDFSINSFISTFLDALLNSIFKIFKNILKFIKAAFYSIMKAFKVLFSSKYTKEEKLIECRKILGATVATLIGLALEEMIEKALLSSFPFSVSFAGYVSPVLAGLIVGIGSVLLMQGWEKYKDNIELTKLKKKESSLLEKSAKISSMKTQISDLEATESIKVTFSIFQDTLPLISSFRDSIDESIENIRETKNKITTKLEEINKVNNENDDLLNLLDTL
ncbi:hypothetical protein WH52_07245 [Tenacibaculum holothuriorum]|uniref:Uncharacterized protein n=1 Tax=Tenacibaculum holothuriorum TaxID=1635173 RepID=A0A1Y2PDM2_9FLAO|nr:hypothetical protein [Tenacibaculum holothuriorum]OSY88535.1 hypothetical protein WH52_07245 [Tenacibaculum holothuriorum]